MNFINIQFVSSEEVKYWIFEKISYKQWENNIYGEATKEDEFLKETLALAMASFMWHLSRSYLGEIILLCLRILLVLFPLN